MYLLMLKFLVGDLNDLIANKTSWISKIYIYLMVKDGVLIAWI